MEKIIVNKRERIALYLFIAGVVWWIADNFYFGWNMRAESALEGVADFIVWVLWGLAFFIRPTRIENTKIEHTTMVNTPIVEIIRPNDVIMKQQQN